MASHQTCTWGHPRSPVLAAQLQLHRFVPQSLMEPSLIRKTYLFCIGVICYVEKANLYSSSKNKFLVICSNRKIMSRLLFEHKNDKQKLYKTKGKSLLVTRTIAIAHHLTITHKSSSSYKIPEAHLPSSDPGLVKLMLDCTVWGKESPRWVSQRHQQEIISEWKEEKRWNV